MTHYDARYDGTPESHIREQRAARRRQLLMYFCIAVMFFGLGSAFGAGVTDSPTDDPTPRPTVTVTETAAP